jgi:glycosyltransferase involved in cell wall biosynthesis
MVKKKVALVLPVYNEEEQLETNALKVYQFMQKLTDYNWKITIVSNGSTDNTVSIGTRLANQYPEIEVLDFPQKGRGGALKRTWLVSDAEILSYMDIDLSADLKFYPKLIKAIEEGFDLAVGSRLAPGAGVTRGFKRETISRSYNTLIKILFRTHFSDAQCGFKAISQKVAEKVLPLVLDNQWFFDSELLIISEKAGLRIFDLPIAWKDDPGSTVKILKTARGDLEGLVRLWWTRPWRKLVC